MPQCVFFQIFSIPLDRRQSVEKVYLRILTLLQNRVARLIVSLSTNDRGSRRPLLLLIQFWLLFYQVYDTLHLAVHLLMCFFIKRQQVVVMYIVNFFMIKIWWLLPSLALFPAAALPIGIVVAVILQHRRILLLDLNFSKFWKNEVCRCVIWLGLEDIFYLRLLAWVLIHHFFPESASSPLSPLDI